MEHVKTNSIKAWMLAARPKTLSGAAVPVVIGVALAFSDAKLYQGEPFSWVAAALCLLFAWVMQIDANFINDFFDFARGNDNSETRLGPQRACTEGWVTIDAMKRAIALTTCLACAIGLPLVFWGGLEMIVVGALCVVFCFLYTTWLSYHGLGDLLVLLFFGIIPVCCTYYVQLHTVTREVLIASLSCGLVIDCLLMVNNFRDRDNDRLAGKMTLAVRVGERGSLLIYLLNGLVAIVFGITFFRHGHPWATVLPLLYLVLHILTYLKIKRINHGRELNACLADTSRNILVYGLLVAIGILI